MNLSVPIYRCQINHLKIHIAIECIVEFFLTDKVFHHVYMFDVNDCVEFHEN